MTFEISSSIHMGDNYADSLLRMYPQLKNHEYFTEPFIFSIYKGRDIIKEVHDRLFINIKSVNELIKLSNEVKQEIIIRKTYEKDDKSKRPVLEIYDYYRE